MTNPEPHQKPKSLWQRMTERFTRQSAGVAAPGSDSVTVTQPFLDLQSVMNLYERDPTCKASIDLLSAASVGIGFYTTADAKDPNAAKAKDVVDDFCWKVNLDRLLGEMARNLIGCGNDFWLRLDPNNLKDLVRLPLDFVSKIERSNLLLEGLKIPYQTTGYVSAHKYGGKIVEPSAMVHWCLNPCAEDGFGVGLLQVLLHTLTVSADQRPAFAWMKAKLERMMPRIFEKYAGPNVVVQLEGQKEDTIKKLEAAVRNKPEEGAWLFSGAKSASVNPVTIDPRASGFAPYIEHIVNQFYIGLETALPALLSAPSFLTKATAEAAMDIQSMITSPIQRYIKRNVEREIFASVLNQAGYDQKSVKVRLNWGSPEQPEILIADLLAARKQGDISQPEFRKNVTKFAHWELETELPSDSKPADASKKSGAQTGDVAT